MEFYRIPHKYSNFLAAELLKLPNCLINVEKCFMFDNVFDMTVDSSVFEYFTDLSANYAKAFM